MHPCYFGDADRPLFGVYHPPVSQRWPVSAVLCCPPVGQEYMRVHRDLVRLARRLSSTGHHVLRFDYYGTGDSSGETGEGHAGQWRRDVRVAADELKDLSGAERVSAVGMRFGAILALDAMRDEDGVADLVLWDPVVSGGEYLRELESLHERLREAYRRSHVTPDEASRDDLVGFPFPAQLRASIREAGSLLEARFRAARVLVIASEPRPDYERLCNAIGEQDIAVDYRHEPSPTHWDQVEQHDTILIARSSIEAITSFLNGANEGR